MGFKVILSKELKRVFGDKKMVFSLFILPVIMIAVIIAVMFFAINNSQNNINKHVSTVSIYNAPEEFTNLIEGNDEIKPVIQEDNTYMSADKESILNGGLDLIIEFPENFAETVANSDSDSTAIQVKTYYNPSEDYSSEAREKLLTYLEQYRLQLVKERFGSVDYATVFYVDSDNSENAIQDNKKATGKMLGMFVPYIVTIMIFAGAMGLGVDSVAGEKERGTMANLLISPVKRVEIVMGKIVGLGIVSVLSAASYVVTFALILIVGGKISPEVKSIIAQTSLSFTGTQIAELLVLLVGIVWLYVGLIGMVSVLSKNIKEAQAFIMPVYLIVMIAGMVSMYSNGAVSSTTYLIPLYNISATFKGIFTEDISLVNYLTATGITYLCAILLVAGMTKAVKSEKIMLNA